MEFKNLLTFQIDTKLIQSKLQNAFHYLQQKIRQMSHTHDQMQHKVMALDLANENAMKRHQKIQKFAFDNFRLAFNELVTLKSEIDQNIKKQPIDQNAKKSNLATIFQDQIQVFSKQTKVLHKKVSELEIDIIKAIELNEQETKKVKNDIKKYNEQITGIRKSISLKFQEFQKESQTKNQEIKNKIKEISTNLNKSQKKIANNRISKIVQEKIQLQPIQEKNNQKKSKKDVLAKLKKQIKQKVISQHSSQQKIINEENDDLSQKKNHNKKYKNNNFQEVNTLQQIQQMQDFKKEMRENQQRLINQLRESLTKNLNERLVQFQAQLQKLQKQEKKKENDIEQLKKNTSTILESQTIIIEKLNDSKNQINNIKNSIYEINQKHNLHSNNFLEHQAKFVNLQDIFKQLNSKVTEKLIEIQFQQDYRKFKSIQNIQKQNGVIKGNVAKNAYSSVHVEENYSQNRLSNINERLQRLQQKFKLSSGSNLPRIDSNKNITGSGKSNQPSFDVVKKQLQKINQQLNKTNEKVGTLKKNLKELYDSHNQIPKKFQEIQRKIRQKNDLQQDRLLELIKEIINRCLTDPFNNNFTNTLKRQINIKFLQIKHQYSSIWKDIQLRVSDRAQVSQLTKLKEIMESSGLQLKSMINKKADNEDFKKGLKYMDAKLKQIYIQLKNQQNVQNKKYFMGKK